MIGRFLRWAEVERGMLPATIKVYRRELEALADASYGPVERLGTEELRDYLYSRGGAPATVAKRLAVFRSFFRYLVRSDARPDDPTARLDRPKVRRGLPRPVRDLVDRLDRLEPRMRLVAIFLAETGLRISEACSLDEPLPIASDLLVRGKGEKERIVPLTEPARQAFEALGGRMPTGARQIQRVFKLVGFTPHRLRHTLATQLADDDVDITVIQKLLGHASSATTQIYADVSAVRIRRAMERRERAS